MTPANRGIEAIFPLPRLDPGSDHWVRTLSGTGTEREEALARLHELLLKIAKGETRRAAGNSGSAALN